MIKKIFAVFFRDVKVNSHDPLTLFILIFPVLFAIGINLITPGINDTTVSTAMVSGDDAGRIEFFKAVADVELFDSIKAVEERAGRRDDVIGIVKENGTYVIIAQGDEPKAQVDSVKLINALYDSGTNINDSRTELVDFGKTVPPLKKVMTNGLLLFISVFAGMITALNILEEKADRTVQAINVTPLSRPAFILGKSISGMLFSVLMSVVCLAVTGFLDIGIGQTLLVIASLTVLSMITGFLQGLNSNDVMEAAGSVKLMFLPLLGSILGYELLAAKWQVFLYWSPYYWAYKAIDLMFSGQGTWLETLIYTGVILLICGIIYVLLSPKIRKGLA